MNIDIPSLIVFVLGLILWVATTNSKALEIGRALMWCGLFVFLLLAAHTHHVQLP